MTPLNLSRRYTTPAALVSAASRHRLAHRLAALAREHAVDRDTRRRPGAQEPLHLVAAGEAQKDALLLGLHPLAQHREAERAAERHDRLDDHAAVRRAAERRDELLVDLELVDREAAQIAETRIARAEIVERDLDAERAQLVEPRHRVVRILDQHALGDLEHQPRR